MDKQQIKQFMNALGCDAMQEAGEWVRGTCPLAPFLHSKGKDTKPSFGMKEEIGGAHFHCFTCLSGTPTSLVDTLEMYLKEQPQYKDHYDLETAKYILENQALNVIVLPDYDFAENHKPFSEWAMWYIEQFPNAFSAGRAMKYLTQPKPPQGVPIDINSGYGRGLTEQEVLDWGFRYDPVKDLVCIPFYNLNYKLAGMRGRSVVGSMHHDYTFQHANNTQITFLNESCFHNDEPVVVVEGQFDLIKTKRVYPNVCGNLTARMSKEKLDKLSSLSTVILMLDNDKTGQQATEKVAEYLTNKGVQVGIASVQGKDPDGMTEEQIYESLKPLLNI